MINKRFIITITAGLLLASSAFGQELRKETLIGTLTGVNPTGKDYAVFYASGMPVTAIWFLGMKLSKNGATIRHTTVEGNGGNMNVNDKVPFRFIIAPTEASSRKWAEAMSFNTGTGGANTNLDANGGGPLMDAGCNSYGTTEFPKGSWRLPTQRELQLMWLFREGINTIYSGNQLQTVKYWSATEKDATNAWFVDFSTTPSSASATKTTSYNVRCVRDY